MKKWVSRIEWIALLCVFGLLVKCFGFYEGIVLLAVLIGVGGIVGLGYAFIERFDDDKEQSLAEMVPEDQTKEIPAEEV